jgi:hypothetical protein
VTTVINGTQLSSYINSHSAAFQYTINGKKVEVAVKVSLSTVVTLLSKPYGLIQIFQPYSTQKIISGQNVLASGTLVNPESLDLYKNIPELQQ